VGEIRRAKDRWRFIGLERSTARRAAPRALPADVFVVLLKPRVNYARGINERPRQSDRIEIRPQLGTIGIMIERTRSRFNVKYTGATRSPRCGLRALLKFDITYRLCT